MISRVQKRLIIIILVIGGVIWGACTLYIFLAPRQPLPQPKHDNRPKIIGHYISDLALYEKNLYFGAGYCFFELELNKHELHELRCSETDTLFLRPVSAEDRLYAMLPGEIFAIPPQQGNTVWKSEDFGVMDKSATIFDKQLYVTARGQPGEHLLAIDAVSGKLLWSYQELYRFDRSLPFLFYDKYLWLSTRKSNFFFQDPLQDKKIVALDPKTGQVVRTVETTDGQLMWSFNVNSVEESNNQQIDVENPLVFELDDTLYSVDPQTGDVLWQHTLLPYLRPHWTRIRPQPLVNQGVVYIGNRDTIDVLDLKTGELLWQVEIDDTQIEWYEDS